MLEKMGDSINSTKPWKGFSEYEKNLPSEGEIIEPGLKIIRKIAQGGMSLIYQAEDIETKEKMVIKLLHPCLVANQEFILRFSRESKIMTQLRGEYFPEFKRSGILKSGFPYIIYEYLEGKTLFQLLKETETLRYKEGLEIAIKICRGLKIAHSNNIIHRDLKPENIFIVKKAHSFEVKLLDFGISKIIEGTRLTSTGMVMGTPNYMSPEQIRGDDKWVGPRTDIWALGIVLYEMLTGQHTFKGKNSFVIFSKILSGNFIPPSKYQPDMPPKLENIILRCLNPDPENRPGSVSNIESELVKILNELKAKQENNILVSSLPNEALIISTSKCLVKARGIIGAERYLRSKYGRFALQRIKDKASLLLQNTLEKIDSLLPQAWISLGIYKEFLRLADSELGTGDLKVCWDIGYAAAHRDLKGPFRVFIKIGVPTFLLPRAGNLWKRFYSRGKIKAERIAPGHGRMVLEEWEDAEPCFCGLVSGWIAGFVEFVTQKKGFVTHPYCYTRGDTRCEWEAKWKK
jgi:serine/threonine-protein kinase